MGKLIMAGGYLLQGTASTCEGKETKACPGKLLVFKIWIKQGINYYY